MKERMLESFTIEGERVDLLRQLARARTEHNDDDEATRSSLDEAQTVAV